MSDYIYDTDGKLHTRYSELIRCTTGQVGKVVEERITGIEMYKNEAMAFGEDRHELWADESRKTGMIPVCFKPKVFHATHVEKEFTTEILPNVIVHSRPDVVSVPDKAIIDHKTLAAENYSEGMKKAQVYRSSKQLPFYAIQLGIHNTRIKKGIYTVEIWNKERDKILGYTYIEKNFTLANLALIMPWVRDRVAILLSALKEAERNYNAELLQRG